MNELFALIDLIKDPSKYKKAIEALDKKSSELDEKISLVGKAREISALHDHALKSAEDSNLLLKEAKTKADKIINSARDKVTKRETSLKEGELSLVESKKVFAEQSAQKYRELNNLEARLKEESAVLSKRENEVSIMGEQAEEKLGEVNRKKAIFDETAERLSNG